MYFLLYISYNNAYNHYYEKFDNGTINDITDEIPFEIPTSWKWCRFNNVVNYKMGKTPPRSEKAYWGNDYKWVSIADMKDSEIIFDTKEGISQKGLVDKFSSNISPKGTLIMSFKLTVGKVSILGMDALHNEAIISIFPFNDNNNVFRDYLFKVLPLMSNFGEIKDAIKGRTLNSESINKLFIPLPPINEQNRIIKKINTLLPYIEKYDKSFAKLETLNSSYKEELKKSILQYAIQGNLVPQDPNDEAADILVQNILAKKRELIKDKQIKKENLSIIYKDDTDNQFYEKFDDGTIINITDEIPFEIPNNWVWTRLENITSKTIKRGKSPKYVDNSNVFVFAQKCNQKNGIITLENAKFLDENTLKRYDESDYIENLDIVINSTGNGTLGRIGIINDKEIYSNKVVVDSHVTLIRLVKKLEHYYIFYVLRNNQKYMESQATGSTNQTELSPEIIKKLLVPIPPFNEQKQIVNKINNIFSYLKTAE